MHVNLSIWFIYHPVHYTVHIPKRDGISTASSVCPYAMAILPLQFSKGLFSCMFPLIPKPNIRALICKSIKNCSDKEEPVHTLYKDAFRQGGVDNQHQHLGRLYRFGFKFSCTDRPGELSQDRQRNQKWILACLDCGRRFNDCRRMFHAHCVFRAESIPYGSDHTNFPLVIWRIHFIIHRL